MQVDTIRRYPSQRAAQLVVEEANRLCIGGRFSITRDPVEKNDRDRGVGDYAVWFQRENCTPLLDSHKHRTERILDQAEARVLAQELSKYQPTHALLRIWWVNPDNQPHKWNFRE